MSGFVDVRPYAELNDFVAADVRGTTVRRPVRPHQTVKDIVEAMGIPHTEIDLILVDGTPVDFSHRPRPGGRVAVYPMFEALDISPIERLRPAPLRDPRFLVDVNVGRLAGLLRLLGFDATFLPDLEDAALAETSAREQRILLTRDRGLLARRAVTHGLYVRADRPREQVVEVVRRLDLEARLAPFTRCLRCNGILEEVAKSDVEEALEPLTRQYYEEFRRCTGCGRIYWAGSHHQRLAALVAEVVADLGHPPQHEPGRE
ncbi:MAG: Mut7-C ubiquitin/RNAse domain-containing protein [Aldersonia sp.]|nr:Mut7-C ubiquitin/RNAse domain-containing protein [Aldersonia sp.]